MRLNLGCGENRREGDGWVNVDKSPACKPDEIANVFEFPWPWRDGCAEEVLISHVLEHCPHFRPGYEKDGMFLFMEQLYRVLVPDGIARIAFPHVSSYGAFGDPTHERFLTEGMFGFFNAPGRRNMNLGHYPIKTDFSYIVEKYQFSKSSEDQTTVNWKEADHQWNILHEVTMLLRAHKPSRIPFWEDERK